MQENIDYMRSDFAFLFNKYQGSKYPALMFPVIEKELLSYLPQKSIILDVCCGTGQLASKLCAKGFTVYGVDWSEEMLNYARINAPEAHFIQGDLTNVGFSVKFNAVVSTDSINHIMNLSVLAAIFNNLYASLLPEGTIAFDIHTEERYKTRWNENTQIIQKNIVVLDRYQYNEKKKLGKNSSTLFLLEDGLWIRKDIQLFDHYYSMEDITLVLKESGFSKIKMFDLALDFGIKGEEGRILVKAQKM